MPASGADRRLHQILVDLGFVKVFPPHEVSHAASGRVRNRAMQLLNRLGAGRPGR